MNTNKNENGTHANSMKSLGTYALNVIKIGN